MPDKENPDRVYPKDEAKCDSSWYGPFKNINGCICKEIKTAVAVIDIQQNVH